MLALAGIYIPLDMVMARVTDEVARAVCLMVVLWQARLFWVASL
ncbi:MAG TPA: hypothetical protein VJ728_00260 [Candidatus Binataceae bacterium]|nr:hypothetical protein [Candidatus Binataceae bacterium]